MKCLFDNSYWFCYFLWSLAQLVLRLSDTLTLRLAKEVADDDCVFWGYQRRKVMREICYIRAGCLIVSQMWVWLVSGLQSDILTSSVSENEVKTTTVSFVMLEPYR